MPPGSYDKGAKVATQLASALCTHFGTGAVSPELLLFAVVQSDQVAEALDWDDETLGRLENEAVSLRPAKPRINGWAPRTMGVLRTAWDRGVRRGGAVTRGDLLSGLAGASGSPGKLLKEAHLHYERFDTDERLGGLAELEPATDLGDDDPVWAIAINDDRTQMPFVTQVLREQLGHTEPRAQHLMYATHIYGAARVGEGRAEDLRTRVSRALGAARAQGFPFELRLVASAAEPRAGDQET